jgi:hypothetical protein
MKTQWCPVLGISAGLLLSGVLSPTYATRYVSTTGGNLAPYTTWATAARAIQTALNAASSNETILVNNGTYNISPAIDLRDGKILRSVNGRTVTTIYSDHSARCVKIQGNAVLDGFSLRNGRSSSSDGAGAYIIGTGSVVNCDIRNCSAGLSGGGVAMNQGGLVENCLIVNNHSDDPGGGISMYNGGIVRNCLISSNTVGGPALNWGGGVGIRKSGLVEFCQINNNFAEQNGGGVHIVDGGEVRNCVIRNNTAVNGGGVTVLNAGTVRRCLISQNVTTGAWPDGGQGGGLSIQGSNTHSVHVVNCKVTYNYASDRAGGIMITDFGRVINSEISHNTAAYYGGGLFLNQGGLVVGSTIVRNTASAYRGGGIDCWVAGSSFKSLILNSIIYYNSAGLGNSNVFDENGGGYYDSCCIPQGPAASAYIVTNEPGFMNSLNDFRLNPAASPLMGGGFDNFLVSGILTLWECDLMGNNRAILGHSDIGAYEAYGAVNNMASSSGRSDLTTYRNGQWYFRRISGGLSPTTAWGYAGALPVAAKFSGGIRLDPTVVDPQTGLWYIKDDAGKILHWAFNWGWPGARLFAGDYDGDGNDDLVAFDVNASTWYLYSFRRGILKWAYQFGFPGTVPVNGDFDGDGRNDLAVFYPPTGAWYIYSIANNSPIVWGRSWGYSGCIPVSGDFDGDGCDDLAVYDPIRARWYIRTASDYPRSGALSPILLWDVNWGFAGGTPLAGDYDYDGKSDIGVYSPNTYQFYIRSMTGTILAWGTQSPSSGTGTAIAVKL